MDPALRAAAVAAKGFMPPDEGDALHAVALAAARAHPGLPLVEVGSYCGRSTVWLGAAAREAGTALFTVDHHRGSEENQPGWQWHDPSLVDEDTRRIDTLPYLRHALADAGLETTVSVVVGTTQQVATWWRTPVSLLFLDGNHTEATAQFDFAAFAPHVIEGGLLAVHDVFPDPRDGGQPPWHVVQRAMRNEAFVEQAQHGSLRVLRRTAKPIDLS